MELTVLGRYGTFPPVNGATVSYILKTDKKNIVLELGSSTLPRLQQFLNLNDIDFIILSHLHADHICDIFVLRYMAEKYLIEGKLKNKIKIYCPDSPVNEFSILNSCKAFEINIINKDLIIDSEGLKISFYPMTHSAVVYGIRVEENGRVFAYTGDTTVNENLREMIKGADSVLGDCGILKEKKAPSSPHLAVSEMAELTKNSHSVLYTGHLAAGLEKEIFNEASAINPKTVMIEEFKTYVV